MSVTEIQLWGLGRTADVIPALLSPPVFKEETIHRDLGLAFTWRWPTWMETLKASHTHVLVPLTSPTAYSKITIFPKI